MRADRSIATTRTSQNSTMEAAPAASVSRAFLEAVKNGVGHELVALFVIVTELSERKEGQRISCGVESGLYVDVRYAQFLDHPQNSRVLQFSRGRMVTVPPPARKIDEVK